MNPGELTLLQRIRLQKSDNLRRSEKLRRELAAEILGVEPEPRCSQCRRHPDEGRGLSPNRSWCRDCENERRRTLYHARRARQATSA